MNECVRTKVVEAFVPAGPNTFTILLTEAEVDDLCANDSIGGC